MASMYENGKAKYTSKKKVVIGDDDYLIYSTRFHGKSPHNYMVKRNGVWFTYGFNSKRTLFNKFPKLKGKY